MKIKAAALAALVVVTLAGCVPMPPEIPTDVRATPVASEEADRQKPIRTTEPKPDATPAPTASEQPAASSEPAPSASSDPEVSVSQENAIQSAEDYLAFMAFSREGLIEQLEYEGYSAEEASYAVDSLKVDWNAQAEASAKEYLDAMPMSKEQLQDQLEYEGFTPEQVAYGVEKSGL